MAKHAFNNIKLMGFCGNGGSLGVRIIVCKDTSDMYFPEPKCSPSLLDDEHVIPIGFSWAVHYDVPRLSAEVHVAG